ncbi:MAG: hypothetical protein J6V68_00215 [Clostridia bacterium]|nr:hypothetical protein [Clostridia bacterium]
MKKIFTIILALLMALSVVISGCTFVPNDSNGNDNTGNNNPSSPSNPDNPSNPGGSGGSGDSGDSSFDDLYSVTVDSKGRYVHQEGVTYSDQIGKYDPDIMTEAEHEQIYNKEVFYRNDISVRVADPEVLYITDTTSPYYDMYFMYGTTGNGVYNCFNSKDLVSWQGVAGAYVWPDGGWQYDWTWAPGAVYDEFADRSLYGLNPTDPGKGVYFIFCSALPSSEHIVQNLMLKQKNTSMLDCAVSTSPAGPFVPAYTPEKGAVIDGVDYSKQANVQKFTVYDGYTINSERIQLSGGQTVCVQRYGDTRTANDTWWNFAAARASLIWQYENKAIAGQKDEKGVEVPIGAQFMNYNNGLQCFDCMDPTPFLDYNDMVTKTRDGKTWQEPRKYLFFTRNGGLINTIDPITGQNLQPGTEVCAVKFYNNEWSQPDYSTLTRITRARYNFISEAATDYYNKQAAAYVPSDYPANMQKEQPAVFGRGTVEDRVRPEPAGIVNEGAQLYYNKQNGMYYLTISTGQYTDNTYCLVQLVAYSVLGPYRKLDVGEGGMLLGTDSGRVTDAITGPGHHTFMDVYDHPTENDSDPTNDRPRQLAIVYHRHVNINYSDQTRGPVVDEAKFVTNSKGLLVMHLNGPTSYIQPRIYATGETKYYNIASEGTVKVQKYGTTTNASGNNINYLTDGIIPFQMSEDDGAVKAMEPYVYEYTTSESRITVTITFPTYRKVTALMVYNSKDYYEAWSSVREIEFDVRRGNWTATAYISKLNFDFNWNKHAATLQMRPGGSATAYFDEIEIKEIRFSIGKDSVMSAISIPEIVVLGTPNGQ